jgi:glucosyl-dolichyl phosphate glucuronosyltransferase
MNSVDLSVVVCTYNRSLLLTKCLEGLAEQQCPKWSFEVVVVDNGSTDDTRGAVSSFSHGIFTTRYVYEKQRGLGRARNIGLRSSQGRYIAYLDDDAVPDPRWCASICEAFENCLSQSMSKVGALGGPVEAVFEGGRPPWLTHELETVYAALDLGPELARFPKGIAPVGANMAFTARALLEDPWDESLMMWEDIDMSMRLASKGLVLLYVPEMRVRHFVSAGKLSIKWLLDRYYSDGIAAQQVLPRFHPRSRLAASALYRFSSFWMRSRFGPRPARLWSRLMTRWYGGYLIGFLGLSDVASAPYLSKRSENSPPGMAD